MLWFSILSFGFSFGNIFFLIRRSSLLAKATSAFQRFWNLTFYLFWVLEFIVFIIFSYLLVNTTHEVWQMDVDVMEMFVDYSYNMLYNFMCCWFLLFCYLSIINYVHTYDIDSCLSLFFIFTILIRLLMLEVESFIHINSYYSHFYGAYDPNENLVVFDLDMLYMRPLFQYFYAFAILKIWHLVYIIVLFIFLSVSTIKYENSDTASYNNLFYIQQNCIVLFVFYVFFHLTLLKVYSGDLLLTYYHEMNLLIRRFSPILWAKLFGWNYCYLDV